MHTFYSTSPLISQILRVTLVSGSGKHFKIILITSFLCASLNFLCQLSSSSQAKLRKFCLKASVMLLNFLFFDSHDSFGCRHYMIVKL